MCTVMSVDHDCTPEIAALIGTSAALAISDIPWNGPVGALKVGLVDGKMVFNPNSEQRKRQRPGRHRGLHPQEGGHDRGRRQRGPRRQACSRPSRSAHEENQKIIALIDQMVAEIGKPKFDYRSRGLQPGAVRQDRGGLHGRGQGRHGHRRQERPGGALERHDRAVAREVSGGISGYGQVPGGVHLQVPEEDRQGRGCWRATAWTAAGKNEIRPLAAEVGVLPRVHGSGLFTRGQTQVLSVCTLDTLSASQKLDTIWEETEKRYMHHYNFPGYSVGEARARPLPRPPGDRPRRSGRAGSGARAPLRGGVPLRHPRGV